MKQFKIGIVYTTSPLTDIPRWYSLLSSIGDVSLILPHERNLRYDCIIIPDAGVNTNINAFKNRNYIAIGSTPICPMVEMFRIESIDYYLSHGVPVIGIGQSRCLVANHLENLKCIVVDGIPAIPYNHSVHEITILKKATFIEDFECGDLYGLESITSNNLFPILKDIKEKTIKGEMDSNQLATIEPPLNNPPSNLKAEEGW